MNDEQQYHIDKDIRFGPLELIDIPKTVEECEEAWFNQTLCRVNDCVVRLGIIHGEFHWHKHEEEDEMFYVVAGHVDIHLRDRVIGLDPDELLVVPRGVEHKPVSSGVSHVMLFEPSGSRT